MTTTLRYGSVCSGIEAASVAWHGLGWQAAWFSEIEAFPSAVLKHHYPAVPNLGDMTALPDLIRAGVVEAPDLLCGGTPCQAFSIAGLRQSLDDARGNLSLTFCELADAIDDVRRDDGGDPAIVFWENVPGVLSTKDNAFGCFLAGLAGEDEPLVAPGGKWSNAGCVFGPARAVAWRVLDAQYFGVAQRRRRLFVVASARDGFDPAAVLFEFDGVRRDSAPRREAGKAVAASTGDGVGSGGEQPYAVANCLTARMHKGLNSTLDEGQTPVVTHSLRGEGFDASEDGTGRGTPLVPVAQPYTLAIRGRGDAHNLEYRQDGTANALLTPNGGRAGIGVGAIAFHPTQDPIHSTDGTTHAMGTGSVGGCATVAVAFSCKDSGNDVSNDISPTLRAMGGAQPNGGGQVAVAFNWQMGAKAHGVGAAIEQSPTLGTNNAEAVAQAMQVRRLTPVECCRLQGFPDDYLTQVPWRGKPTPPDGPMYKALGNSWAVPVVRWIGRRIDAHLRTAALYYEGVFA